MNLKQVVGVVLIASAGGFAGCVTTPESKTEKETAYTPPSEQPQSSNEYWEGRDSQDRTAVAKSIADGKGP